MVTLTSLEAINTLAPLKTFSKVLNQVGITHRVVLNLTFSNNPLAFVNHTYPFSFHTSPFPCLLIHTWEELSMIEITGPFYTVAIA